MKEFVETLPTYKKLEALEIAGNEFSEKGVLMLATWLKAPFVMRHNLWTDGSAHVVHWLVLRKMDANMRSTFSGYVFCRKELVHRLSGAPNVVDLYPVVVMRLACPRPYQLYCSTIMSVTYFDTCPVPQCTVC